MSKPAENAPSSAPPAPDGSAGAEPDRDRSPCAGCTAERWWGRPVAETRAGLEFGRLLADPVWHGSGVPHGDGRPVILIPGFLAGDRTMSVIATWLRRVGYRPRVCGSVTNTDCSDRALDRVARTVDAVSRSGGRRVALLGHSRGGHFARALAARHPDRVSHAISMGADLQGMFGVSEPTLFAVDAARRAVHATGRARRATCMTERCSCRFGQDFVRPFPFAEVRLTSIYSKGDGVVHWECQVIPQADCIEVTGSHVGLIFNRKVYRAVAGALNVPELPAPRKPLRRLRSA